MLRRQVPTWQSGRFEPSNSVPGREEVSHPPVVAQDTIDDLSVDLTTVGGLLITLQKGGCHDAEVASAVSAGARASRGSKGAEHPSPERNVQHCVGWLLTVNPHDEFVSERRCRGEA